MSLNNSTKTHECRARDIKRRLEVIQKKMADLQELGVPCAFCYTSMRNTGTLFTMGNTAMTQVIESCRDAILQQLSEQPSVADVQPVVGVPAAEAREIHMVLPPLPAPLEELSLYDLKALVVGIIKDLGLKWTEPKPAFWPDDVPYQYPRSAPDGFQGSWTKSLRRVVESIYSFFENSEKSSAELSPTEVFFTNTPFQNIPFPHLSASSPSSASNHVADMTNDSSHLSTQQAISVDSSTLPLIIKQSAPLLPSSPHGVLLERTSSGGSCIVDCRKVSLEQIKERMSQQDVGTVTVDAKSDADSTETISVVSEDEEDQEPGHMPIPPVSYFGYETAPSETSQSPPPVRRLSSGSEGEASIKAGQVNTTAQPQMLYFAPRIYSQFYPQLQFSPLMIPPSLLMKQLYPVQTLSPSKKEGTTASESATSTVDDKQGSTERHQSAGKAPMSLSFKLPKSSFALRPSSHGTAEKGGRSSNAHFPLHQQHSQKLEATGPLRTKISSLEETRSKRGKHGIYIYTTPSAPLKFMSLNSRKESASSNGSSRKLVAGAPVSPPGSEAVVLKDSGYQLQAVKQVAQPMNIRKQPEKLQLEKTQPDKLQPEKLHPVQQEKSNRESSLQQRTSSSTASSPPTRKHSLSPTESGAGSTPSIPLVSGRRNAIKRKRELVFHWYQSPSNSHSIPKRTKMLDSV